MSAKVLLDSNKSPTREQVRCWFNRNRNLCRCTGYKPLVDAVMDAAAMHARREDRRPGAGQAEGGRLDPRHAATSVRRRSPRSPGTWDFGADVALRMPDGTLRLALVQAKVSHALIKGIDTSEAEKMPGVAKVITWKDVKGKNAITGLITFPTNKGDGWDRPILCKDKVFQFGDAIAIVAADTEEHARAAAEKVKVDLEVLPAYMSGFAALAPDAMEIHPGVPNAYYEQGVVKGEDTKPFFDKRQGDGRHHHLLQPPAASASGARLRRRLHRRRRRADDPVQEHRRASASRDDLPRHRRRARRSCG